eukprot:scaffold4391_cov164-Ochromonas_danica.AAC.2
MNNNQESPRDLQNYLRKKSILQQIKRDNNSFSEEPSPSPSLSSSSKSTTRGTTEQQQLQQQREAQAVIEGDMLSQELKEVPKKKEEPNLVQPNYSLPSRSTAQQPRKRKPAAAAVKPSESTPTRSESSQPISRPSESLQPTSIVRSLPQPRPTASNTPPNTRTRPTPSSSTQNPRVSLVNERRQLIAEQDEAYQRIVAADLAIAEAQKNWTAKRLANSQVIGSLSTEVDEDEFITITVKVHWIREVEAILYQVKSVLGARLQLKVKPKVTTLYQLRACVEQRLLDAWGEAVPPAVVVMSKWKLRLDIGYPPKRFERLVLSSPACAPEQDEGHASDENKTLEELGTVKDCVIWATFATDSPSANPVVTSS